MTNLPHSELAIEFARQSADLLDQSMIKIRHCTDQLSEHQIWWRPAPSLNSIGNLLLHLTGNLKQWGVVPFTLANDRRDREAEFLDDSRQPSEAVLTAIQQVVDDAKEQWGHLAAGQLMRTVEIQGFDVTHLHAIMHTSSHFVGHTHQIVQLTRIQLGGNYQFHWSPTIEPGDLPI